MKITVPGAGLAGLSAAEELTRRGHEVDVLSTMPPRRGIGMMLSFLREKVRGLFSTGLLGEASVKNHFNWNENTWADG